MSETHISREILSLPSKPIMELADCGDYTRHIRRGLRSVVIKMKMERMAKKIKREELRAKADEK